MTMTDKKQHFPNFSKLRSLWENYYRMTIPPEHMWHMYTQFVWYQ